jgi:hypothetical protein
MYLVKVLTPVTMNMNLIMKPNILVATDTISIISGGSKTGTFQFVLS